MPPISFVVQMKDLSNPWTVLTLLSLTGLTVLFSILTARKFVRWMNSKEDRTVIKDLKNYLSERKEQETSSVWDKIKANFQALLDINTRLMNKLQEILEVLKNIQREGAQVTPAPKPVQVPAVAVAKNSYFSFFEKANWKRSKTKKTGDYTYYVKEFVTGEDDENCEIVLVTKIKDVAKSYAIENGFTHYCKYDHTTGHAAKIRVNDE